MAAVAGNISNIRGIYLKDGDGTKFIDLDVQTVKALNVLYASSLNEVFATIENKPQIKAGTAIYRVIQRLATRNNANGTNPRAAEAGLKKVDIDLVKEHQYQTRLTDLYRMGASLEASGTVDAALLAGWAEAQTQSVLAYLTCHATSGILAQAVTNTIISIPKPTTTDDYRKQWKLIVDTLAENSVKLNELYLGLNKADYALWSSRPFINDLLLATTNLGSEKSTEMLINGLVAEIGGLRIIENIFLGQNIAAGVHSIDENDAFDLSAADAILIHKEAYAYPYNMIIAGSWVDPLVGTSINHRVEFVVPSTKGLALRPELIKGFKITTTP